MVTTPKHIRSYSMPDAERRRPSLKLTPDPASVDGLARLAEHWGGLNLSRAFDRLVAEAVEKLDNER